MQVDALLTRNMRTPTRAGGISKRTRGRRRRYSTVFVPRRVLFLASNPEFYLQRFRLQVILNMNTHSNPRRALKSAQERRSKDRRRRRNERDRARVLQRQRNKGAKDWESGRRGIVPGALLKLLEKKGYLTAEKYPWTRKTLSRSRVQNGSWNPRGKRTLNFV